MKNFIKRTLCIGISFLIFSSMYSCDSGEVKGLSKKRFTEESLKIPEINNIFEFKQVDDGMIFIGKNSEGVLVENYYDINSNNWSDSKLIMYVKGDKTDSYNINHDDNIKNIGFLNATISKDCKKHAIIECDKAALENAQSDLKSKTNIYDINDNKTEIDINNEELKSLKSFEYSYNGDIYAEFNGKIVQYDGNSGQVKYKYDINEGNILSICSTMDYLIVVTTNEVIKYNMKTGEKIGDIDKLKESIENTSNETEVFSGSEGGNILLTNSSGLFKYNISKDSVEKIIDGNNNSIGDINKSVKQVIEIDKDNYLILYQDYKNNQYELYKYSYSEKLSKQEISQLTVYSLYQDDTIKDLIRMYQKNNQDIEINYEVGIQAYGSISEDDAIKKLNTEIMAGKGPDVLFLDGMSSNYYEKKGILEDISDIVDKNKDDLFEGITAEYSNSKKVYMFPLMVSFPVIIGEKNFVSEVNDFESLSKEANNKLSEQSTQVMYLYNPEDLVNLMYYTSSDKIIEDNKINESYLMQFLQNTKELYSLIKNKTSKEDYDAYNRSKEEFTKIYGDSNKYSQNTYLLKQLSTTYFLRKDLIKIDIGNISSMEDIVNMLSVINKMGDLGYKQFSADGDNRFIPRKIISINSKSESKKLAKEFVSSMFEIDYQINEGNSGLPVNREALSSIYDKNIENKNLGSIGVGTDDGNVIECKNVWPTMEEYNGILNIMNNLDKKANIDKSILDPIIDGTNKYISEEYSLDEAVKYISKQLQIKLSE